MRDPKLVALYGTGLPEGGSVMIPNPITAPGVYPLETRECPQHHSDGTGPPPNRARIHSPDGVAIVCSVSEADTNRVPLRYGEGSAGVRSALHDFPDAALHPSVRALCPDCHGTGRVPDEKGPKVEIKQHPCGTYFWNIGKGWLPLAIGMPTPAEAYHAAQRAYEDGKR